MGEGARLIVCDDEPGLREMLEEYLGQSGFTVACAADGAALRALAPRFRPDLTVLDINMPGENGLSLARWLREEELGAVLMLTANSDTIDRIVGLELGADDYLGKPFELRELRARITTVLRRTMARPTSKGPAPARLRLGRFVFDIEARRLADDAGAAVPLTPMELDVLTVLAAAAGRALSRDEIMQRAHGKRWEAEDRSLDLRIARLRRKIEWDAADPRLIRTVRNEGYMLVPDAE